MLCWAPYNMYTWYTANALKGVHTYINYCFSFSAWHKSSVYPGHEGFPEPRLLLFARQGTMKDAKGLVAAEKQVLLKFTIYKEFT